MVYRKSERRAIKKTFGLRITSYTGSFVDPELDQDPNLKAGSGSE